MTKKYIELNEDLISKLTENKIEFEEIEIEEKKETPDLDNKLKELESKLDDKYTKIINEKDNVIKSFSDLVNSKIVETEKPKQEYQSKYLKNLLGGKKTNEN